jgi:glycosyltransferase involved in cell wall biosynthesis
MMGPRVSVCVVTYNHAPYIRACLESVLAQQLEGRVEILVGVDVSTDDTAGQVVELAARHPGVIRPFVHAERQGAAGNVKFLMARAEGEFIAHLDGDDAWLPGKLAAQLALFDRFPEAVAAYCNACVVEAGPGGAVLGRFSDAPTGLVTLERLLRRGNFLNNSSLLFRASARSALQSLPAEYLDFRSHLTLATLGPLAYSDEALVVYRWSTPGSLVSQANARVRELYWQALEGLPEGLVDPAVRRAAHADFLRRVAFRSVRSRQLSLWRGWWARVRDHTPGPGWRLALAVAWGTMAEALRQVRALLFARRAERRVFYFHGGR